jgi:aminoglycoside 6'-N-acetyltransferase
VSAWSFRRLGDDDLPLLHRWLNEPGVVRWWEGEDVSWDAIVAAYGSSSDDDAEHWIASLEGREVGWIQCWAVAEALEEDEVMQWLRLGVPESAGGIDYLVGEPADRGRGVGSALIRSFVEDVVFVRHPSWTPICASPYAANVGSWRALEKAGFRLAGSFDDPEGPCNLMVRDRPA